MHSFCIPKFRKGVAVLLLLGAVVVCPPRSLSADDKQPVYPTTVDVSSTDAATYPSAAEKIPGKRLVLTLDDCIRMALERNERLIASGYDIQVAESQLMEAKAQFWPVLEYKYRMAPVPNDVSDAFNKFFEGELSFFNSLHVGIGFPVTTFGQLAEAAKMARGGIEAAKIRAEGLKFETTFQVKKIYYGILFGNEMRRILEDAIEKMGSKIEGEESKEDPDMDPYDLLRLKVFREELRKRLSDADHSLDLAYDAMRVQLDLNPETVIVLDRERLSPLISQLEEEKEFVEAALVAQPDSKLVNIGIDTKRRQYRLEKLRLLPRAGIGFFADVGRSIGDIRGLQLTDDFNNPFNYTRAGVGLEVSGDIDFHGAAARIKKAKAEYYKASQEGEMAKKGVGLRVREAYHAALKLKDEVDRAQKTESMAHQMVFLTKINIDTGIGDDQKYADSLQLLLLSRGQYYKTVLDFNLALAELEKQVGNDKYVELSHMSGRENIYQQVKDSLGEFEYYQDNNVDMEGIHNEER